MSQSFRLFRTTSNYLPAQPQSLAEAVPGIEGEYPCTSRSPVIRKINKGLWGVWAWWERQLRKLDGLFNFVKRCWLPTFLQLKASFLCLVCLTLFKRQSLIRVQSSSQESSFAPTPFSKPSPSHTHILTRKTIPLAKCHSSS